MGDLIRGETFADGEVVNAARLHSLVENALIKAGVINGTHIAALSITSTHLAASLNWGPSNVALAEGRIIAGNASGVGVETSLDSAEFWIVADSLGLKPAGIAASKLAGGILATQLAGAIDSTKLTALVTAGTTGSASLIPVITVDVAGRITAITTVAAAAVPRTSVSVSLPAAGVTVDLPHTLGRVPIVLSVVLVCGPVNHNGYTLADEVPIEAATITHDASSWPLFTVTADTSNVHVTRALGPDTPQLMHSGTGEEQTVFIPANWTLKAYLM